MTENCEMDLKLLDYLSGDADAETCREVESWVESQPENRAYFEKFHSDYLKIRWTFRGQLIRRGHFSELKLKISHRLTMWSGWM